MSASSGKLAVGDSVRCERAEPARGTWSRYSGKLGTVVTINRQRFDNDAPDHVEYGVSFDNTHNVAAWFLSSELVVVESAVMQAAERRLAGAEVGEASCPRRM